MEPGVRRDGRGYWYSRTYPIARLYTACLIRRSSKSVMANIAEGYGRYHYLDSLRFYYIARGSLAETISHIITARDLAYIDDAHRQELYNLGREAERTLNGYIGYVRKLKTGSETYGDRYISAPDEAPAAVKD
ncbi:MAG: four helix bundle protein [Anaerolineae bacterium]